MRQQKKLLCLIGVAIGLMLAVPALAQLTSWDIAADWVGSSPPSENLGPDGSWSYGLNVDASPHPLLDPYTLVPFSNYEIDYMGWGTVPGHNVEAYDNSHNGTPSIVNTWNGLGMALCGPVLIRWKSLATQTVDISGLFQNTNTPTDIIVRRNDEGTALFQGMVTAGPPTPSVPVDLMEVSVVPNDYIYVYACPPSPNWFVDFRLSIAAEDPTKIMPTPTIHPATNGYSVPPAITIDCSEPAAIIHYTTDGSDPTIASPLYTGAFYVPLDPPTTVKARAWKAGWTKGDVASETYSQGAAPQVWDVRADWQDSVLPSVNIGPDHNWSFGLNIDSNRQDPTAPYLLVPFINYQMDYMGWGGVAAYDMATNGVPCVLRIPAGGLGMALAGPVLVQWTATRPILVNIDGEFNNTGAEQSINVRKNGDALMFQQILSEKTGSNPDVVVALTNVSVEPGDVISFYVCPTDLGWTDYVDFKYMITEVADSERTLAAPSFSPPGGAYTVPQAVTMTAAAGAAIHYTTNGIDPTLSSTLYTTAVTVAINPPTTLKARCWLGGDVSGVKSNIYSKAGPLTWNLWNDWAVNTIPAQGIGAEGCWSYGTNGDVDPANPAKPLVFQPFTRYNPNIFGWGIPAYCTIGPDTPALARPTTSVMAMCGPTIVKWRANRPISININGTFGNSSQPNVIIVRKNAEAPLFQDVVGPSNPSFPVDIYNVSVDPGDVIYLYCVKDVSAGSAWFVDFTYVITEIPGSERPVAAPSISPWGGAFTVPPTVTLTAQAGATIRYTTNGADPTTSSPTYTELIVVPIVPTTTLKAKAWVGSDESTIRSAVFTKAGLRTWALPADWEDNVLPPVGLGPDDVWSFGMNHGPEGYSAYNAYTLLPWDTFQTNYQGWGVPAYCRSVSDFPSVLKGSVTRMACHSPSLVKWTSNRAITVNVTGWAGNLINPGRPEYVAFRKNDEAPAVQVLATTGVDVGVDINATGIAVEPGDSLYLYIVQTPESEGGYGTWVDWWLTISEVAASEKTAAPAITPGGGVFFNPLSATIGCATYGATIHYTTNNTTPTSGSPVYTLGTPIPVSSAMTIKAMATSSMADSAISVATFAFTTDMKIADVKKLTLNNAAGCQGVVVTQKFDNGVFYVEEPDRSFGICCVKIRNDFAVGSMVDISGTIRADSASGEPYIDASNLSASAATGSAAPVGLNGRSIGGGIYGLQEAIPGTSGLNNIGMLVKVWGAVTPVSATRFIVNDGSKDIVVEAPSNLVPAPGVTYAVVTGVVSYEKLGGIASPVIRVGTGGNVVPIAP